MEMFSERERYIQNPLRLLHALTDLAMIPVIKIGEAQEDCWSEEAYPKLSTPDKPQENENDLLQLYLF